MTNYKPISLLNPFPKVLQRIIYDRLFIHIQINNILVEERFGFRTSSSTDKAAFQLIDEILNALNYKMMVRGIFCDFEKAFDCVNHNLLLHKI
jgi:sarcosine oxidase/L-pipecolate oxidase